MEWNSYLWLQIAFITVYLRRIGSYNCRYYAPSVLRPGPTLSVDCNNTAASVSWDVTDLNVDLEALYVEYVCDVINPTHTSEQNTAELTGPVYEVYTTLEVSSSSTLVTIEEGYSCRYFGCARHSLEKTWYTFNTVNCVFPTSSALPLTTANGLLGEVQPTSVAYEHLTSEGNSGTASSTTTAATTLSSTKGIPTTSVPPAIIISDSLRSAIPTITPVSTTTEIPRAYSGAWRVPLVAVMTSLIAVGLLLLLVVIVISRRSHRRNTKWQKYAMSLHRQDKVDLLYFPVQPDLPEKISIFSEYSEFDQLYASQLELAATIADGDSTSTISSVLQTHLRSSNSESSADGTCQDHQVRTPITDTSGGTDGYMETYSEIKPDITVADLAKTTTVDGASSNALEITSAEELSKCRQTLSCTSAEPRQQQSSEISVSHRLPPRKTEYVRCQDENSDDDAALEFIPDDTVDIWNIESGSVSGESFVEVDDDDI